MKEKIIVIFITLLFLMAMISVNSEKINKINNLSVNDTLDQSQEINDGAGMLVCGNWQCWGQIFYPTLDTLSRIEILIKRVGEISSDLYITIKNSKDGANLVYHTKNYHDISGTYKWIEFDFDDISVIPGEKYYLCVATTGGDNQNNFYVWDCSIDDVYIGDLWFERRVEGWFLWDPQVDGCFRTYGYMNEPPNNPTVTYNKNEDTISIVTSDPNENLIRYGIDWNNTNSVDFWTEYVTSSSEYVIQCNGREGIIGVIAEDEIGLQSDWISVKSLSKNYNIKSYEEGLFGRTNLRAIGRNFHICNDDGGLYGHIFIGFKGFKPVFNEDIYIPEESIKFILMVNSFYVHCIYKE